jgi:hypothetical protein
MRPSRAVRIFSPRTANLTRSLRGKYAELALANLTRQSAYSRLGGYENVNDAEGEGEDRDGGEAGIFRQHAQAVFQILD